jgi:hypothetical protein
LFDDPGVLHHRHHQLASAVIRIALSNQSFEISLISFETSYSLFILLTTFNKFSLVGLSVFSHKCDKNHLIRSSLNSFG